MQPNSALHPIDFSLQTSVSLSQFNNFPSKGALTFSCWIKFNKSKQPNFDTSNLRLFSYDDRSTSDHPNAGGSRILVLDPSNITVWFGGTSVSTGARVDDGQWHHLAISIQQDDARVVMMPGAPAAKDPYEELRRLQWVIPVIRLPPPPQPDPASVGLFKRTVVAVYRDGQQEGSAVLDLDTGFRIAPNGPFVVSFPFYERPQNEDGSGNQSRLVDRYVHDLGSIADVRVWAAARTGKQLAVEMTGYLGGHPDLCLHWLLGFDSSRPVTIVPDETLNHNNGHLSSIDTPRRLMDQPFPHRDAPVDLTGVDLSKAELTYVPLAKCNLSGATLDSAALDNANLSNTNLTGAVLHGATLRQTSFIKANLHATDFHDTDLTAASFDVQPAWSRDTSQPTNLEGAIVSTAILGKDWSCLHLTGAKVHGLDQGTNLTDIIANSIVFHNAPMSRCSLPKSKFNGADLTGASLDGADLYQCSMVGTTLYGANLSSVRLAGADLTGAKLGGSKDQRPASLTYAYMPGVKLTNAELFGVVLSYAQIYGEAKMDGVHLEAAKLANANLCGMDFRQSHMKGVDLTGALLMNCQFDGVDLSPGDGNQVTALAGAFLQGASFVQADLSGANLSGAVVAQEAGSTNVQQLTDDNKLESVELQFGATNIPVGAGNADTIWPNLDQGQLQNASQLIAPNPPQPAVLKPIDAPW